MSLPETNKPTMGTQIAQLGVVIVVLAVAAYFILSFIMSFFWWIVGALGIVVTIINYKTVLWVLGKIKDMYSKNIYMGIGASLALFVGYPIFSAYLLIKTIWDFRNSDFIPRGKGKTLPQNTTTNTTMDIDHIELPNIPKDNQNMQ